MPDPEYRSLEDPDEAIEFPGAFARLVEIGDLTIDVAGHVVSREDEGRVTVDAVVVSSCVQMPSLPVIAQVEAEAGIPVVSAAVCTTYAMLRRLGLETVVPQAGALLSGKY